MLINFMDQWFAGLIGLSKIFKYLVMVLIRVHEDQAMFIEHNVLFSSRKPDHQYVEPVLE